jgi:hypothetical protein
VARGKRRSAALGSRPAARPDVLTNAETIVLPATDRVAITRTDLKALSLNGDVSGLPAGDEGYVPTRRRTLVSRLALLVILVLQAGLSLRLRNSAFEDEALYLYVGRLEIAHLLHGAALPVSYASYFSGAPVLYPVLGAALNAVGGLALARALSLAEMLAVTAMLYSITRFLFNERAALCAAALFAVSESAIFLANFATFDATCLFLLAGGTMLVVRTSRSRWPVFLLAAPVVALAVAVKYAGLLFVPTIAFLPALAGWPALSWSSARAKRLTRAGRSARTGWSALRHRAPAGCTAAWFRALLYPLAFCAAVAGLLYAGLRFGGHAYLTAISATTTNRVQGGTPSLVVLRESAEWGGVVALLAVFGSVSYARRARTEPDEEIAPAGGPFRRALLGIVLTGTVLLAPAYQMHLHTDVSLHKHIGFGLFFAAPMAGVGLARLVGDHFRRPQIGVAVWSVALVLGMSQSAYLYHEWPPAGPFVRAFSAYLEPRATYLVEVPEVPIYYLEGRADAQPSQFWSTYSITYRTRAGLKLTGISGFTAAIRAGYFHVVAYDGDITPAADAAIARTLKSSRSYRLATVVRLRDSNGPVSYYIWVHQNVPARRPAHRSHRSGTR